MAAASSLQLVLCLPRPSMKRILSSPGGAEELIAAVLDTSSSPSASVVRSPPATTHQARKRVQSWTRLRARGGGVSAVLRAGPTDIHAQPSIRAAWKARAQ